MISEGTRAAGAAISRRVKQQLVRILFGNKCTRIGHEKLDNSIYSYNDLKRAYLVRLHEIHPDKSKCKKNMDPKIAENSKKLFHELNEIWNKYEALKKFNKGNEEANFTMFGVGCSFSDNEKERLLRNQIMDQACRGWFSSGSLAATCSTSPSNNKGTMKTSKIKPVSLVDESMFELATDEFSEHSNKIKGQMKGNHDLPTW